MAIKEKILRSDDIKHISGKLPVEYLYTAGNALEPFFKTIKEKGKFTGRKCEKCGIVYVPPAIFCERCLSRLEKIITMPDTGTVESYTESHLDIDGKRIGTPVIWGIVRLDGSSTVLVHKLICKPSQARIGMRVKARFLSVKKRTGAISDIEGFTPSR